MSGENTNTFPAGLSAVPSEAPPAYEPKPADDVDIEQREVHHEQHAPTKSTWKRVSLSLVLVIFSLWFTILVLDVTSTRRSGVVYSSRYSKDYRYRPAASPVITETLVDGRTRIRGAQPTLH